jgi:hemin uptake protein HemP
MNEHDNAPRNSAARPLPREIPLEEILRGAMEVVIVHGGARYVLRITRNGKLILTK